jgi:hypothetical protein
MEYGGLAMLPSNEDQRQRQLMIDVLELRTSLRKT